MDDIRALLEASDPAEQLEGLRALLLTLQTTRVTRERAAAATQALSLAVIDQESSSLPPAAARLCQAALQACATAAPQPILFNSLPVYGGSRRVLHTLLVSAWLRTTVERADAVAEGLTTAAAVLENNVPHVMGLLDGPGVDSALVPAALAALQHGSQLAGPCFPGLARC